MTNLKTNKTNKWSETRVSLVLGILSIPETNLTGH